jgi:hypothetical protein
MLRIIQDMAVCVHRSAIKRPHCRHVLRDIGILNTLHSIRCSRGYMIYNFLARHRHITSSLGEIMHEYIIFMFANVCSFRKKINNFIDKIVRKLYDGIHYSNLNSRLLVNMLIYYMFAMSMHFTRCIGFAIQCAKSHQITDSICMFIFCFPTSQSE